MSPTRIVRRGRSADPTSSALPATGQGKLTDKCKPWLSAFCTAYQRREITVLRVSVGILYLWFGVLKFIPALSPAEDIATVVMSIMTFDAVPAEVTAPLLALMEVLIGIGLVTGRLLRLTLVTFFVHMAGVFVTLAIVPGAVWSHPLVPTLEGQYIIKNLVLVAACLSVAAAAVRGSRTAGVPEVQETALAAGIPAGLDTALDGNCPTCSGPYTASEARPAPTPPEPALAAPSLPVGSTARD
ncbi:hypothetical protein BJP40_20625 [Streptomyces sp. CC53]|uniref:hypothetical protein n=1 Tax=unclassified Streptomyces TaxID=2593676 RepID=UPI0008DC9357|nr:MULTISPECIES: hypothetical protein [unclassified Streptomyces]OII64419.1 hypothetical protein BJP40_20625 [Streptomyces sp. CC53]